MENKKARILIEEVGDGLKIAINGSGEDICKMLSLVICDISKEVNISIKELIDDLYAGALAHKILGADDSEKALIDIAKDLCGE